MTWGKIPADTAPELVQTAVDRPDGGFALQRKDWIAGLDKGLAVLSCFDEQHPRMTAAQMAQRVGLTRTAARRYLLTLQHLGYVASDDKLFWLTPRILRLSHAYLDSSRLARIAQPFLQRIAQGTGENTFLSVPERDHVVYIARHGSTSTRPQNIGYMLGTLVPAHVTAAGMLFLALREQPTYDEWLSAATLKTLTAHSITDKAKLGQHLRNTRFQDWALSEQQLELNFRGVAVPVRDTHGELVAALSITLYIGTETSEQACARVLKVLQDAAASMRNLL
jgi:IclR family transcriptional regulator, pca regulon regulatory protein